MSSGMPPGSPSVSYAISMVAPSALRTVPLGITEKLWDGRSVRAGTPDPVNVRFVSEPSGVTVEQVRPEITYALRERVLRPGRSWVELALPGDRERSSGHFAAYVD